MKHAETVTFGGSGLDRAAQLRADSAALDRLSRTKGAQTILLWRGKPLIARDPGCRVAWLNSDHALLQHECTRIFLGRDGDTAYFAQDISDWEPQDQALPQKVFFDASEQSHPQADEGQIFAELRGCMSVLDHRDAELAATAKALFSWHKSHQFCALCGARSQMSMAGWQRGCPACGGQHFPRTDPVVIMLITHGNDVLLGRSPGWPEGMYSLLAGFVEPGETIEAAVRRETLEETGISVGPVRYLASQPWPFPTSLMFGCAGEAHAREIVLDPQELDDARWISREEMVDVFAGTHTNLTPPRKGAIAAFILRNWLMDRLD